MDLTGHAGQHDETCEPCNVIRGALRRFNAELAATAPAIAEVLDDE
jgi:hypothetical protein